LSFRGAVLSREESAVVRSKSRFLSGKERRFGMTKSRKLSHPHLRGASFARDLTGGCKLFDGSNACNPALVRAFDLVARSRLPEAAARQKLPANETSAHNLGGGTRHLNQRGIRLPWFAISRFAKFRFSEFRFPKIGTSLLALSLLATPLARAVDAVARPTSNAPSSIVIGFVGGFVGHDNLRHGPVQLAERIRQSVPKDTYVHVFENRRRRMAYEAIMRLLDTDHDGALSAVEKARAHIILFGHSWGAAAAVLLARDLRRAGIPVMLTVQVDSIAKSWQEDGVIPDNVAQAINFYQPHGILHGRTTITAADPVRTQVLGNFLEDYKKNPIACPEATWFARTFTAGHMESECDPQVWLKIEGMVRQRLALTLTSSSASAPAGSAPAQHP
jgi:hypothetical protein